MAKAPERRRAYRRTYLAAWRQWRARSQEELAEALGVTVPQVSRLENGHRGYTQEILEKAAAFLDCTEGEILAVDPFTPDAGLLSAALRVPPERRREAIAMMHVLAEGRDDAYTPDAPRRPPRKRRPPR